MTPDAAAIGFLINPKNPLVPNQQGLVAAAARTAGVSVIELTASTPEEFEAAFMVGRRQGIGGLIVSDDPVMFQATQLVELSARYAIPAIYPSSLLARAGGLIAYSPSLEEIMRRAGAYVGRVLKGANPADLPVEQPTKFELVINLKTAKALSLTVPPPLLARADEVIE